MITGVCPVPDYFGWLVPLEAPGPLSPSPQIISTLPVPTVVPTHIFSPPSLRLIGRSVRIRQCLRSFYLFVPSSLPLTLFFLFFSLWFVVVLVKKKLTGRYALSSLDFFLLPSSSRHCPVSSASSRACGTTPHAVVEFLRGAVFRSLFCRLE
jgi:hypothetical protein